MASPLQSFLSAQSQGQDIAQRRALMPIQQESARLGLQAQKAGVEQGQKQFSQQQSLQGINLMGQVVSSIKRLSPDPAVRLQAFQRVAPELAKFDVQLPQNLSVENFTDEGLRPLELNLSNAANNLTASEREFEYLAKQGNFTPEERAQAARYQAGIGARPTAVTPEVVGEREKSKIEARESTQTGQIALEKAQIDVNAAKQKLDQQIKQAEQQFSGRDIDANNAIQNIDKLLDSGGYSTIYGKVEGNLPELFRSQASLDAIALRDQIVGLLSLENRQKLKGQGTITDSEAKTLERAATILANPTISDGLAKDELERVKDIFGKVSSSESGKQPQILRFDAQGNLIQ